MKTINSFENDCQYGAVEAKLRDDDSLVVEYFPRLQGELFGRKLRFDGTGLLGQIEKGEDPDEAISWFVADAARHLTPDRVIRRGTPVE